MAAAAIPEALTLLSGEALAALDEVNRLGSEYALRGFARELTRQRMTLSIRLHGCSPPALLAWLAPGLRGAGCTLTNGQIAHALGIDPSNVRRHLAKLEATGEIQRRGKGRARRLTFGVAEGLHEPPEPARSARTFQARSAPERARSARTSQEEEMYEEGSASAGEPLPVSESLLRVGAARRVLEGEV